ncbi:L-lactate dehydrogenase [Globicatella sanguinis]|uniref:L-lactate dehydrogenase n=1 Tax=Globicatella sanguinis TaxID=13076 RepID=UPI000C79DD24|nr:L-lactate dehydrogenase [Globicatella sanguinis]MDK7630355.1 L-lactate dehydrogenase [Globicatella sanguinis]WIK67363.1 L-lactate dehydrogenase [Globicatella sanguinis]WKT56768.1 L-lactate dehydrogenase [Globicatella sanguinis]
MSQKSSKSKIILVGDGAVGSSFAFATVTQNIGRELGIIDINTEKTEGDALDLSSALAFTSPKKIYAASYADCHDADIVVITAGAAQKPGETRLDLVHKNLKIFRGIIGEIVASGFDGIFLIASNPVDVLTYATWKFSGFPKERVIGSGTSLDTARFRQRIADLVSVDARNVHGYILGEHGDTEFPVWSHANIGGLQIADWVKIHPEVDEEELVNIFFKVRDAAYEIIAKKGATYYGIAVALASICKAILDDNKAVFPLSVYLNGEYGQKDIFIGAPAVIGRQGIETVIEIPLNDAETEKMNLSATTLKNVIDEGFALLEQ